MLAIYTITILLSALLLFLVQPMAAKMLLPSLGGSPSVWNTSMVFFQAMLLAGYLYAHLLTRWLAPRAQVLVHAAVVALPLLLLPIGSATEPVPSVAVSPAVWLLGWLTGAIGGPFFVLATTTPLLQRWFASTAHRDAEDPYFLYVASNVGSMVALLGYPLILEPMLRLRSSSSWSPSQTLFWSLGYAGFALLAVGSGFLLLRQHTQPVVESAVAALSGREAEPSTRRRLLWVVLALVPCSAMLAATHLITSEIAAVPLLWVVPLALYLLTFILAFSRRRWIPDRWAGVGLAVLAVLVAGTMLSAARPSAWLLVPLHLLTVFAVGLVCHGRLAADRPAATRLTEFYLLIALGGVLGGVFNSLVAPAVFDSLVEYPIALVAACLLRPGFAAVESAGAVRDLRWQVWALPVGVGALVFVLDLGAGFLGSEGWYPVVQVGLPAAACLAVLHRPLRFGSCLAMLFAVGLVLPRFYDPPLYAERTFFGIHAVREVEGRPLAAVDRRTGEQTVINIRYHQLVHGTTRHGSQAQLDQMRGIPTTYYHPTGPIGQVFEVLEPKGLTDRVALVGLGAGTVAAYGKPGAHFTFYEIDPAVAAIAENPRFFTYLRDSRARVDVVLGDGRLSLAAEPDGAFGLIVIDAFSSDSVPVHLITREAIELYLRKLRPGGLVAFHQSSQYLDLTLVVDAMANDLELAGLARDDEVTDLGQMIEDKDSSTWTVLARDTRSLGALATDGRWERLPRDAERPPARRYLWTDDYSNVLSVLRLFGSAAAAGEVRD